MSLRFQLIQAGWLACSVTQIFGQSQLKEHRVLIPERGEVLGYLISVATNHYSFLPPPIWRVSCKPGGDSVVMMSTNLDTSITVEFINKPEEAAWALPAKGIGSLILDRRSPTNSASYARAAELLSSRYPGGRIRETYATWTGVGEGLGFDIERKGGNGTRLVSRVVYARQDWGNIEFTLTAPAAKFSDSTTPFANAISSFHRPTP
jgi:hypothetical protein